MHWIWTLAQHLTGNALRVRHRGDVPAIYLTFDDGPHPVHTPPLLDLLAAHNAKVTFFLLGEHARRHPELVQRMVAEGHEVANHSLSHPDFRKLSPKAQLDEARRAEALICGMGGAPRMAFRPPKGAATMTMIADALLARRPLVLWSFDSEDYRLQGQALLDRLAAYPPRAGDILLFHDDMPDTLAALRTMLPKWRAAGFDFGLIQRR